MIYAQLATLLVDALLRSLCAEMHLRRVSRIGVQQDELADVVEQARDRQTIAMLVAHLRRDAVGRALGCQRVQAKALGRRVPTEERSKNSNVRTRPAAACTTWGLSSSTAETTVSTRTRELCAWLATLRTAMISATSDSTAVTTSAVAT